MKILLVSGSYPPMRCGIGDYTGRLAESLAADPGTRVAVLTSAGEGAPAAQGAVEIIRGMRTWRPEGLSPLRETIARFAPEVVHLQFPTQGYDSVNGLTRVAWDLRRGAPAPLVMTLHEFLPARAGRFEMHVYALALLSAALVVVRPEFRENMPWFMQALVPPGKVHFLPNAAIVPQVRMSEVERAALRASLGAGDRKLVAFFGFSYPHKGVDLLFRIADPAQHHLLLIGHLAEGDAYHRKLRQLAASPEWRDRVTITGFVESARAASLLAAADAAVFPYRGGGGIWNSSLHAATAQGTFVLTTSLTRSGYDKSENVFYARTEDVEQMRDALLLYQGTRRTSAAADLWPDIARSHLDLYRSLRGTRAFA